MEIRDSKALGTIKLEVVKLVKLKMLMCVCSQ
jgi:hypothetical protein